MKARDTVMSKEHITRILLAKYPGFDPEMDIDYDASFVVAQSQAEISFPLGKQEGVKEVMEWINKNITIPYPVGSYGYKLWQAKLESLIEEVK